MVYCPTAIACGCAAPHQSKLARAPSVESIPYSLPHSASNSSRNTSKSQKRSKSLDKRQKRDRIKHTSDSHSSGIESIADLFNAISSLGHEEKQKPTKIQVLREPLVQVDKTQQVLKVGPKPYLSCELERDDANSISSSDTLFQSFHYLGPNAESTPQLPQKVVYVAKNPNHANELVASMPRNMNASHSIPHNAKVPAQSLTSLMISRNRNSLPKDIPNFNNSFEQPVKSYPILGSDKDINRTVRSASFQTPNAVNSSSAPVNKNTRPRSLLNSSFLSLQGDNRIRNKKLDLSNSRQFKSNSLAVLEKNTDLSSHLVSNVLLNSVKNSTFSLATENNAVDLQSRHSLILDSTHTLCSNKYPSLRSLLELHEVEAMKMSQSNISSNVSLASSRVTNESSLKLRDFGISEEHEVPAFIAKEKRSSVLGRRDVYSDARMSQASIQSLDHGKRRNNRARSEQRNRYSDARLSQISVQSLGTWAPTQDRLPQTYERKGSFLSNAKLSHASLQSYSYKKPPSAADANFPPHYPVYEQKGSFSHDINQSQTSIQSSGFPNKSKVQSRIPLNAFSAVTQSRHASLMDFKTPPQPVQSLSCLNPRESERLLKQNPNASFVLHRGAAKSMAMLPNKPSIRQGSTSQRNNSENESIRVKFDMVAQNSPEEVNRSHPPTYVNKYAIEKDHQSQEHLSIETHQRRESGYFSSLSPLTNQETFDRYVKSDSESTKDFLRDNVSLTDPNVLDGSHLDSSFSNLTSRFSETSDVDGNYPVSNEVEFEFIDNIVAEINKSLIDFQTDALVHQNSNANFLGSQDLVHPETYSVRKLENHSSKTGDLELALEEHQDKDSSINMNLIPFIDGCSSNTEIEVAPQPFIPSFSVETPLELENLYSTVDSESCFDKSETETLRNFDMSQPSEQQSTAAVETKLHSFAKSVSVNVACVPGMHYLQAMDSPTLSFLAYYSFLPVLHDTCVSLNIVPKKFSQYELNTVTVDKRPFSNWEDAVLGQIDEPVDAHLSRSQMSVAEEYKDWLRANLEPILAFTLWACDENYRSNTKPWCSEHGSNFWNRASDRSRGKVLAALNLDSTKETEDRIFQQASLCFQLIENFYYDRSYFFGEKPSSVDAEVFGYLSPILFSDKLSDQTFRHLLLQHNGLVSLLAHIKDRIDLMDENS